MKTYLYGGLLIAAITLVLGGAGSGAGRVIRWMAVRRLSGLAWVPISINIDVNVPPIDGGGGSGPEFGGKIAESRFDGAFFGGVSATNGNWRIDADCLWAAVGGDRAELPVLRVDVDAIYGHGSLGRRVAPDVYVTGGIRRMATKYEIELDGREFERKPGSGIR